jgi:hypothetical protein
MIGNFFYSNSGAAAYEIEQSLRFDGSSALERIPSSLSYNTSTWTWSVWLKRGVLGGAGTGGRTVLSILQNATQYHKAYFYGNDGADNDYLKTAPGNQLSNGLYRDPSAWYHLVVRKTGSAAGAVVKWYINGVEVKSGAESYTGGAARFLIGASRNDSSNTRFFNGYMAEFNFVEGSSLAPTDFGEFDDNGVWRPKRYTGSYTGNSFYLKFDPTATNGIGHDHSGNGNNFTASGFSTSGTGTDVMSDTPTTNWCTLNPLDFENVNFKPTISEGNLRSSGTSARSLGTIAIPSSGKYYFEGQATTVGTSTAQFGIYAARWGSNGQLNYLNTSGTFTQASLATYSNQTLGIAVNVDDGEVTFYKNNTSVGTTSVSTMAGTLPYFNHGGNWTWTLNFGQRAFAYTPPTGYKALNTANLPAPTIKKGGDHFNTVLYTGNGSNGHAITGVGFQPDLVWGKCRNIGTDHYWVDAVRGVTKVLRSNLTNVEYTQTDSLVSFNSDGFTLDDDNSGGPSGNFNISGRTYAAWNWKANGSGSSNTAGTITSTVSANPTAGFSVVTWTGNGTAGATIGHGLGVKPSFFVVKCRNLTGCNWDVYHSAYGATKHTILNGTNSVTTYSGFFNNTEPTSTLITLGSDREVNQSGATYVAYCWAEVPGYSSFGSYVGNGNADGPFVYTGGGFRPAFLLIKRTDSTGDWFLFDTARDTYNASYKWLKPNNTGTEPTGGGDLWDILSNGFKVRNSNGNQNASGGTYIFMAFAEHSFGGVNVSPATAR